MKEKLRRMPMAIYLAPSAVVTGDVTLGENVNIWYGAVLRGDSGAITVGEGTNIQENCVLHEKTTLGADCTVGHGAILHGCTVGDGCLIGMGAIVLDGAELAEGCLVGAGALVTGKTKAEAGSVLLGSPAKVIKIQTPEQIAAQRKNAEHYVNLARGAFPAIQSE
jgi:carbonic anhydrase/acetyltransferase-like protein (isoleucine patch superfamily)